MAGAAMARAALELGFDALELGYRLTEAQGADIVKCVERGEITAPSVHAYCPEPTGVPSGHPELYLLGSTDPDESAMAAIFLRRTLEFAKRANSRAVVLHAGRVRGCWVDSSELLERAERFAEFGIDPVKDWSYRWRYKLNAWRRKRNVKKHWSVFCRQLDALLPLFEKAGVALCLENLPSSEAFQTNEFLCLVKTRGSKFLRLWHDIGHDDVQMKMGWSWGWNTEKIAKNMLPFTAGVHIHDVKNFKEDHHAPGRGKIDFKALSAYGAADVIRVLEPSANVPASELREGLAFIKKCWSG